MNGDEGSPTSARRLVAMASGPFGATLGDVPATTFTVRTPYVLGGAFLALVALLA